MFQHLALALLLSQAAPFAPWQLTKTPPPTPVLWAPFTTSGPLMEEDANTVAHVYWNGRALVDTKGNPWVIGNASGVAPEAQESPYYSEGFSSIRPGGAGPFTASNYYEAPSADPFDFSGSHTICVAFRYNGVALDQYILTNGSAGNVDGFRLTYTSTGSVRYVTGNAGNFSQSVAALTNAKHGNHVACAGWDATTNRTYVKVDGGTTGAGGVMAGGFIPGSAKSRIGISSLTDGGWGNTAGVGAYTPGLIYEIWAAPVQPTEAVLTAMSAQALSRLGKTEAPGTLFDTGSAVSHVVWRAGALVDLKGNAWTMVGTVPQAQQLEVRDFGLGTGMRNGVGPFSSTNYYFLPGNNALSFPTGTPFTVCVLFSGPTTQANAALLSSRAGASGGFSVALTTSGAQHFFGIAGSTSGAAGSSNLTVPGALHVGCAGYAGDPPTNTVLAKLDFGSTAIGNSVNYTQNTTTGIGLGALYNGTLPYAYGAIYEVWVTTTVPSDALFTKVARRVHSMFLPSGQTLSVTRADGTGLATYATNGRVWRAPAGVPRITENGLVVEAGRTNLALYSEEFDNAWWSKIGAGTGAAPSLVGANTCLAPDGNLTADVYTFNKGAGATASDYSLLDSGAATVTSATALHEGVWIRTTDGTRKLLLFTCTGCSVANPTPVVVDGTWRRVTYSQTTNGTVSDIRIGLRGGATTPPTDSSATVCLWGAQIENATSTLGSYIPTSASTAARNADVVATSTVLPSTLADTDRFCASATGVRPTYGVVSGFFPTLISAGPGNANSFNIALNTGAPNATVQVYDSAGTNRQAQWTYTAASMPGGEAHRFGACSRGGTLGAPVLYVDGNPVGAAAGTGTGNFASTQAFTFGNSTSGATQFWDGAIRNVVVTVGGLSTAPETAPVAPVLFDEDAGTVSHVLFRHGRIHDTKGNDWTMNGTVPQVNGNPPGAGPFSDTNYYSLGTGNDVLDFAGDFTACFAYTAPPGTIGDNLYSNGASYSGANSGLSILYGASNYTVAYMNGTLLNLVGSEGTPYSSFNVTCTGRSGTTGYVKTNTNAIRSGTVTTGAATGTPARLGRYATAGAGFTGTLREAWFTTTPPSDAAFTAIISRARARAGLGAP